MKSFLQYIIFFYAMCLLVFMLYVFYILIFSDVYNNTPKETRCDRGYQFEITNKGFTPIQDIGGIGNDKYSRVFERASDVGARCLGVCNNTSQKTCGILGKIIDDERSNF